MTDPLHGTAAPRPNGHDVGFAQPEADRHSRERLRVLELSGEYDIASVDALQAKLADDSPAPDRVLVVDLSDVTFLDAGCTGRLLSAAAERQVVVVGATGIVARILDLMDPDQQLARRRTLRALTADAVAPAPRTRVRTDRDAR